VLLFLEEERVRSGIARTWRLFESLQGAALPSLLYAIQNYLMQTAYQQLDPMIFNILNQTKTLFAALCLYIIMRRRQSYLQMVALSLVMGAAVLVTQPTNVAIAQPEMSLYNRTGIVCMLAASFLSGLSSAITQRTLQDNGRNAYLFSLELSAYSTFWVLISLPASREGGLMMTKGPLYGWTYLTWIPVLSNSLGGILVGQVTKYAGSVEKGFALVSGILFTALLRQQLYSIPLTQAHWIAFCLVAVSIWMHSNFPPIASHGFCDPKKINDASGPHVLIGKTL